MTINLGIDNHPFKHLLTKELISANLGYRPWMGRHAAHSFYAWPKVVFMHRHHPLEPRP